jgi:hypothetical protein
MTVNSGASRQDEGSANPRSSALRPIIENYPDHIRQTVIRYDVDHNRATISGGLGHAVAARVPHREYQEAKKSFWRDAQRFQGFINAHVPLLQTLTVAKQLELLSMFREERFNAHQVLLHEGVEENPRVYLIAEGQVKLECLNNPFARRDYNREAILQHVQLHKLYEKGGAGNVS